jgi:hypothetical protein
MNSQILLLSLIFNSHQIIEVGGILLLFAIIYVETGFLLGLVLPGGCKGVVVVISRIGPVLQLSQ